MPKKSLDIVVDFDVVMRFRGRLRAPKDDALRRAIRHPRGSIMIMILHISGSNKDVSRFE